MVRRVLLALVIGSLPGLASAQTEGPGRVYVSALLSIPWSQGLTEDGYQIYELPPGGWSVGWSVLGGVFVSPRASVEFEFERTGTIQRTEPSRYDLTYHPERRDNFFTTAVRLHVRPRHTVDLEPVLGFHVVKERQADHTDRIDYSGSVQHSPRYEFTRAAVAGFSVGADLRVGAGHVAFVASFRAHRTFWGGGDFDETKHWTLRPGAGLRVSF